MNMLLNNWLLKLASLILAVALWSHVRGEVNPLETATFSVPLRAAEAARLVADVPRRVRVTVRAPRVVMRELRGGVPSNPLAPPTEAPLVAGEALRAYLDVDETTSEVAHVEVEASRDEVEVLSVSPSEIALASS